MDVGSHQPCQIRAPTQPIDTLPLLTPDRLFDYIASANVSAHGIVCGPPTTVRVLQLPFVSKEGIASLGTSTVFRGTAPGATPVDSVFVPTRLFGRLLLCRLHCFDQTFAS